jgi:acylphosphatase
MSHPRFVGWVRVLSSFARGSRFCPQALAFSSLPLIAAPQHPLFRISRLSVTIFWFVTEPKQARKYLISGTVQGVGYRYFTQRAAAKIKVGGYVKNLNDGRVEVFVMGSPQQLREMRTLLERGPRFSSVTEVREEVASPDPQYDQVFVIGRGD